MFKSERREIKRRNGRKMKVDGRSVFVVRDAQRKRDQKFKQARDAKRISPMSV